MELLCKVCDCELFENEAERKKYLATLLKKLIEVCIQNILLIILIWMNSIKY